MPYRERSQKLQRCREYHQQRQNTHRRILSTFTAEEASALDRYARREGISTARLVSRLAVDELDGRLYVPRVLSDSLGRISRLLGRMSTNVNQIAYAANKDALVGRDIEAQTLFRHIHQAHQDVSQQVQEEFDRLWRQFHS